MLELRRTSDSSWQAANRLPDMVHLVHAANSARFTLELRQMFEDRRRLLRASTPAELERFSISQGKDRYDKAGAVYLLHTRSNGRHLGSVRLLPTTRPHILAGTGAALCERAAPVAPDVWEMSWFCVAPDIGREQEENTRALLRIAMAEFASTRGIRQFASVACAQALPEMMATGWRTAPLGLPKHIAGHLMGAVLFSITPEALGRYRGRLGLNAPVLQQTPTDIAFADFSTLN